MNDRRLSDAQITAALRAHLPTRAQTGLQDRAMAVIERAPQQRSWPSFLGALSDADPWGRRRSLLLAAALLIAAAMVGAAAVGAWRLLQQDPVPVLDLEPPADVPALVGSIYDRMPAMPPVAITTLEDGTVRGRMYVHRSGAVRFERYEATDAAQPDTFKILNGTTRGELKLVGSDTAWVEQTEAISEDPRVFLWAEMGAPLFAGLGRETDCFEPSDGSPATGWTYVGLEDVAGRPTHHVACDAGDLWVDIETGLVMRTRARVVDGSGEPVPGEFRTIEVTAIAFGEQPEALFEIRPPPGVAQVGADEESAADCATDPICSRTPPPSFTPPPGSTPAPLATMPPSEVTNGWVAYVMRPGISGDRPADIYLAREGEEPRLLVGGEYQHGHNACPRFSPDGSRLAYAESKGQDGQGMWIDLAVVVIGVDAAGLRVGSETRIPIAEPGDLPCPEWSPDGRSLAYLVIEDGYVRLAITDLDGDTALVSPPWPHHWGSFTWAPDGTVIAASSSEGVFLVPIDGSEPRLLRADDYRDLAWSPDGSRLAATTCPLDCERDHVRVIRLDGTVADLDLGPGEQPAWSPNGDRLAYYRMTDGSEMLALAKPDGSGEVRLDWDLGSGVVWSPDGERLLYLRAAGEPRGAFAPVTRSVVGDAPPVPLAPPTIDLYAADAGDLSWQPVRP